MKKTLLSIGLGAGIMYLWDPEHGEERRANLLATLRGVAPKTTGAVQSKAEALTASVQDVTARADEKAADAIDSIPVETPNVKEGIQEATEAADLKPGA